MQIHGPSQVHGAQSIHGPHTTRGVEGPAAQTSPAADHADRLDISEAGRLAECLAEIPDIRAERVEQLRAAIASGSYETADKLDTALEHLLDEIA